MLCHYYCILYYIIFDLLIQYTVIIVEDVCLCPVQIGTSMIVGHILFFCCPTTESIRNLTVAPDMLNSSQRLCCEIIDFSHVVKEG